jgi:hypothetical protein
MLDPTTLNQAIAQDIPYDNHLFECHQEKHCEPSPLQKNFTAPMPPQLVLSITKDDPMQIDDKTQAPH